MGVRRKQNHLKIKTQRNQKRCYFNQFLTQIASFESRRIVLTSAAFDRTPLYDFITINNGLYVDGMTPLSAEKLPKLSVPSLLVVGHLVLTSQPLRTPITPPNMHRFLPFFEKSLAAFFIPSTSFN